MKGIRLVALLTAECFSCTSARSATLSALVSFNGANGDLTSAELIADASGNLYGTTSEGGTNDVGTVFKLTDTGYVVPEPASLALLSVATVALLHRRRTK